MNLFQKVMLAGLAIASALFVYKAVETINNEFDKLEQAELELLDNSDYTFDDINEPEPETATVIIVFQQEGGNNDN